MPVSTPNIQYELMAPYWAFIRNIISDRDRPSYIYPIETYIGVPERTDEYARICYRNEMYYKGGTSVGATKLTVKKLVALFADRPSKFDLVKALEYLKDNCTGTGIGLQEFCEKTLSEVETVGRIGVLMDYPQTSGKTMTKEELNRYGVLPRYYQYNAESIISYKLETKFGTEVLTQLVLKEVIEVVNPDDEFTCKLENQYRVLRLRKEGYTQQLYDKDNNPKDAEVAVFNGKKIQLDYIPFFVCNAEENGAKNMCEPPVLGMANLDKAYLSDSCSHKRYVKMAGTGTLWFTTSHDNKDWVEANPGGLMQMGGEAYNLGSSGQMNYVQAPDTNAHLVSMEHTIDLMAMTGAALINKQNAMPKTAFEVLQSKSAEISPLHRAVNNIEQMIKTLVDWAADMLDSNSTTINRDNNIIELNKVFVSEGSDSELMKVELLALAADVTSKPQVRNNYRNRYGLIPEDITDEEIDKEIEEDKKNNQQNSGVNIPAQPTDNIFPQQPVNSKDKSNKAVG